MVLKNKREDFQPKFECMNVYVGQVKKAIDGDKILGNITIYGGLSDESGEITVWRINNEDGYANLKLIKTMSGHGCKVKSLSFVGRDLNQLVAGFDD